MLLTVLFFLFWLDLIVAFIKQIHLKRNSTISNVHYSNMMNHGFIRLKTSGCHDSKRRLGWGVACVPFWYAALCILWHWVIFGAGELSLLQMCAEEAERHAWRGICSWRVLCHWRSLHRLSAQHPPSLSSVRCQCSIFTMGQLIDGASACALVY